jgi:proline dehydrogenase
MRSRIAVRGTRRYGFRDSDFRPRLSRPELTDHTFHNMQFLRSSLLWASQNKRMERVLRSSSAMRPLVSRFMPGESIEDVMRAISALREAETPSIITYLGENVDSDAAADHTVAEYERLISAISTASADADVSIKLTQFGWDIDRARALDRVRSVAAMAAAAGSVFAIDMESSPYVESTIDAYESVARDFPDTTLCLQAYLHRTPADLKRLLKGKPYIRLVKGAYREPADRALQGRDEVSERYRSLARELLTAVQRGEARVAFGTHDLELLSQIRDDARELGVASSAYEIQMLYGIQNEARRELAARGEQVRVLISYGRAWYAWFMRRLAEKPANILLIARR